MDQSAITVRYAKAFFALAKGKKKLEALKADIELVNAICNESVEFILLRESPIVKSSKKAELITSIFKGKVDELTLNFLLLIVKNKREVFIPSICRNFLSLTKKDQNIKSAVLTTAAEMDSSTTERVKEILAKELKTQIELSTLVNPDIVGGLILRLDDKQYDASIATQLKKVKQTLTES